MSIYKSDSRKRYAAERQVQGWQTCFLNLCLSYLRIAMHLNAPIQIHQEFQSQIWRGEFLHLLADASKQHQGL